MNPTRASSVRSGVSAHTCTTMQSQRTLEHDVAAPCCLRVYGEGGAVQRQSTQFSARVNVLFYLHGLVRVY